MAGSEYAPRRFGPQCFVTSESHPSELTGPCDRIERKDQVPSRTEEPRDKKYFCFAGAVSCGVLGIMWCPFANQVVLALSSVSVSEIHLLRLQCNREDTHVQDSRRTPPWTRRSSLTRTQGSGPGRGQGLRPVSFFLRENLTKGCYPWRLGMPMMHSLRD